MGAGVVSFAGFWDPVSHTGFSSPTLTQGEVLTKSSGTFIYHFFFIIIQRRPGFFCIETEEWREAGAEGRWGLGMDSNLEERREKKRKRKKIQEWWCMLQLCKFEVSLDCRVSSRVSQSSYTEKPSLKNKDKNPNK